MEQDLERQVATGRQRRGCASFSITELKDDDREYGRHREAEQDTSYRELQFHDAQRSLVLELPRTLQ